MDAGLVRTLQARRPQIRARWEQLLHAAPVTTPLANPDVLVHLLDVTLDEVFGMLRGTSARREAARSAAYDRARANCECGRNPLTAYFLAGEQAMLETLVLAQSESPAIDYTARGTAVAELCLAMRTLAQHEVDAFCSVCQHRPAAEAHHKPVRAH